LNQWRATAARTKLNVVVLDPDGTIAHDGRLDLDGRSAIADIRVAGLSLRASTALAT
jgi:hypothetical protein